MDVRQRIGDRGGVWLASTGAMVRRLQTIGIGSEDCTVGLIAPIFVTVITRCLCSLLLFLSNTFFLPFGF